MNDELYHWGIKGMKWGVRRYQNKDGTLTNAGKKKYNKTDERLNKNGVLEKKLVGKFTAKDALKTGGRFIGGVTVETIGRTVAVHTGKAWVDKLGRSVNKAAALYNGYVIANKAIIPSIVNANNKRMSNAQTTGKANRKTHEAATREMEQQQIRQSINRGYQFTQQSLMQNNAVATNQIMGFY